MNEKRKNDFQRDCNRLDLRSAIEIHCYSIDIEFLRTLPLPQIQPLIKDLTGSKFLKLRQDIFSVYLENIADKKLKTLAEEYNSFRLFIPQHNFDGNAMFFKALEKKLGDDKAEWLKARELFVDSSAISELVRNKLEKLG